MEQRPPLVPDSSSPPALPVAQVLSYATAPRAPKPPGAEPYWVGVVSRGCLVLAGAAGVMGVAYGYFALQYAVPVYMPRMPRGVLVAGDVGFALAALFCTLPRPHAHGAGAEQAVTEDDEHQRRSRTLAVVGLLVPPASELIRSLAEDAPSVANPSARTRLILIYAGYVAGMVGLLALIRHLRHHARWLYQAGLSRRLTATFVTYGLSRGVYLAVMIGSDWAVGGPRRAARLPLVWMGELIGAAGIAVAGGLLAWAAVSLWAALRRLNAP